MKIHGRLFDGQSTAIISAEVALVGDAFELIEESRVRRFPRAQVVIRERIGKNPRVFEFPGGLRFESDDNDAVDKHFARRSNLHLVHVFENHWPTIVLSVVLLVAFAVFGYKVVLPRFARGVAHGLDQNALKWTSDKTWALMDLQSSASELADQPRARVEEQMRILRQLFPSYNLKLELRKQVAGAKLNAFALPDGRIIITDRMAEILSDPDEILAVMLHEFGHVMYRHGMLNMIQTLAISGFFLFIAGGADWSSVAGVLVAQSYSRDHEREADYFAANELVKMDKRPLALAEALLRMKRENESAGDSLPGFLLSHPVTDERVDYLRRYR